eukprot:9469293-Pyramimonas_sp.AAC.1
MASGAAIPVLHKSIKSPPPPVEEPVLKGEVLHHPKAIIDHKVTRWHELWSSGASVDGQRLIQVLEDARAEADLRSLPPLTGTMIHEAAHSMKPRAGQGVDRLSQLDIERLPPEGVGELAQLLNDAEACLTWPWLLLLTIGRMLEKKSGGDRIMGLVGMTPRVSSKLREPWIQAWSIDSQPFWGAA